MRLFVALWPGPRVRQALAAARDGAPWPAGASPTAVDKLHLTLHFIGSVPTSRAAGIATALPVPVRGFELRLDVIECWHGGLVVLRPSVVPARLNQLHADLAAALQRDGWPVEARAFQPHVTLARRVARSPALASVDAVRWRVTGYALMQSMGDGSYGLLRRYR